MASNISTFRTGEPSLIELLNRIHRGTIQLPEFQRSWVWDDNHIKSIIASVSKGFPIGCLMLLDTDGDKIRLKPRQVEGVTTRGVEQKQLILDGQQRMTSLYLSLLSGKAVPTKTDKNRLVERYYYFDILKCNDPNIDREEAIISIPKEKFLHTKFDRDILLDLSTSKNEYEQACFPISAILDFAACAKWRREFQNHFNHDVEKIKQFDAFEETIIESVKQYRVPTIELLQDTSKEAVCQVFEKVNTGGVSLTVFELMTATYAVDEYNLREDWDIRKSRLKDVAILKDINAPDFLQAVTLYASYQKSVGNNTGVSCKRKDILNLTLQDYQAYADSLEDGLNKAARLLVREKIFVSHNLPYKTQLIPLSAICAQLGNRFDADTVKQKLSRWYWSGIFGELYGGANETRYAIDIVDVMKWINGGDEPRTIRDANLAPTRLLSLQTRQSAAYKGIMALLMQAGSKDFINGDTIEITTFFSMNIDIHHIFPKKYCLTKDLPRRKWNSVINKAPITASSNRIIGGKAPSKYLSSLEKNYNLEMTRLDDILISHCIEPQHIRNDNFDEFILSRARLILNLIEAAMGKRIAGRDSDDVIDAFGSSLI